MKICLNTHNLAGDFSLEELIQVCKRQGIGGIEFSVGYGHKHGVELETPGEEILDIRERLYGEGLETVSIATYCRFDGKEEDEIARNVEDAKKGIILASQMGAPVFRVVGNDLPDFISRDAFIERISKILGELGDFARDYGVKVLLNMHGTFQFRKDMQAVMRKCAERNCGLVYNCDDGDLVGGSAELTLGEVMPYLAHVHMHEMLGIFPYKEMFGILKSHGYKGWFSIVVDEPSCEPERMIGYYKRLAEAFYTSA